MNVEELKQLLHEQNESVLSTNIPEIIGSVMTLYEKGVEVGMKIRGQIKINQACEWLGNNINNYIIIDDYLGKVQPKISSSMFDDFKKAMEL